LSDLKFFEVFFGFLFGASFGSFANVLIYRMPAGESLWSPSRCSKCGTPVKWYHNIPMLSYFFLKGKCAKCGEPFSIRYPLVEFLMAVLFAAVMYVYGT
jgi:leader peptidase (prepilin peptidase)/N-methyltransferase